MGTEYAIYVSDSNGVRQTIINGTFIKLEYARLVNNTSDTLLLTMPGNYDLSLFQIDGAIEVWRTPDGGPNYRDGETCWFIRYVAREIATDGKTTILVMAFAAVSLLDRRLVAFADGTPQALKTGAADNLLKTYVLENMGSSAVGARNISTWLGVAPLVAQAPSISVAAPWTPLGTVCKNVADYLKQGDIPNSVPITYLYYDIVPTSDVNAIGYEFRTYLGYRGQNHSPTSGRPITFYSDGGNLLEAHREWDYRGEQNLIYMGGTGSGQAQTVTAFENTAGTARSRFARSEAWGSAGNTGVVAEPGATDAIKLASEGQTALTLHSPRRRFWCRIQDRPNLVRGRDWNWGDLVSVNAFGETYPYRIEAFHVTIDQHKEVAEIRLESDSTL